MKRAFFSLKRVRGYGQALCHFSLFLFHLMIGMCCAPCLLSYIMYMKRRQKEFLRRPSVTQTTTIKQRIGQADQKTEKNSYQSFYFFYIKIISSTSSPSSATYIQNAHEKLLLIPGEIQLFSLYFIYSLLSPLIHQLYITENFSLFSAFPCASKCNALTLTLLARCCCCCCSQCIANRDPPHKCAMAVFSLTQKENSSIILVQITLYSLTPLLPLQHNHSLKNCNMYIHHPPHISSWLHT